MAATTNQTNPVALRLEAQALDACIENLEAGERFRGLDRRRSPRHGYRRNSLVLELFRDQVVTARYVVASRNLSRTGIAVVAQQFVYPQHACRIELTPAIGRPLPIDGAVVRCRYLPGQGSLHEVGVQFRRPIDLELFIPEARPLSVLLVDPDPQTAPLVDSLCGDAATLVCASTSADAAAAAFSREFDLILVDLDAAAVDGFRLMRDLRRAGVLAAMVGLAIDCNPQLYERCQSAGCTGYLAKPITREALQGLVDSLRTSPLMSTLHASSELAPLIHEFISTAREHAKTLVAALENDDLATIQRVARTLRCSGGSYGFASISAEATHVETLATLDADRSELRTAVGELIHMCLTARAAPTT